MKTLSFFLIAIFFGLQLQAQETTPLAEALFETMRKDIAGQSYDSKRLSKAKELSDAHFLYVSQIKAVAESMSLESNRLDYVKYAYATTLDAENYANLYPLFKMSSNVEDLKAYTAKRQPPVIAKKENTTTTNTTTNTTGNTTGTTTTTTNNNSNSTVSTATTTTTTGPTPMTDQDFAAAKRQVEGESFESSKLRRVKQMSDANYLLCSQIKELLDVLSFESSKLEYAKYAYPKTYDQANYEIVKTGLQHSKSKEEVTAFLKTQKVNDYTPKKEVVVANETVVKDNANTATAVIGNDDFINVKNQIASQSSDAKKLAKAKEITDKTHFTTAQAKSIVEILLFEENRLDFAKYVYPKVADKDNFSKIKEAMTKDNHKLLDDYIHTLSQGGTVVPTTGPTELSAEDFEALCKQIKGAALESHKLEKAKTMVDRAHLNSAQIKQINDLFTLEESKLDFAQYAYPKALDKDKYSIVRDTLTKSTSKYALDKFIKDHK